MLHQAVSLIGAAMILGAYVALQTRRLDREDRLFNALNFFGSGLLTYSAVVDRNVGFIVLEASWALLSLPGMIRSRA